MKLYMYFVLTLLFALQGCGQENVKQALGNLHTDCVRDYNFSIGGVLGTATVAGSIHCQPNGVAPAIVPATKPGS